MKISIIVPVYNTEIGKLLRCFQSILQITIEYECIIVDDGSESAIGSFCNNFCKSNNNFRYVRKENGGVSSARNAGIDIANGDYICFVDSDDCVISEFYNSIENGILPYDLILSDMYLVDKDRKNLWEVNDQDVITLNKIIGKIVTDGRINGPVAKLIKRSYLKKNEIYFDESMISGEDAVFLMDILLNKPSIEYIKAPSYLYYRERNSGLSRLKNNVELYFNNMRTQYKKTIFCISSTNLCANEQNNYFLIETGSYIQSMFNGLLDASLVGINKYRIQKILDQLILDLQELDVKILSKKARTQYALLLKPNYALVWILARIRKIYLIFRGLK